MNRTSALAVPETKARVARLVAARVELRATLYAENLRSYCGQPNHETVNHGLGQYVFQQVHVNGIESSWAKMERGYYGMYHRRSRSTWNTT